MIETPELLAELQRCDGSAIGTVPLHVDWAPAFEWVRWEAIRSGRLPPVIGRLAGRATPILGPRREEHRGPSAPGVPEVSVVGFDLVLADGTNRVSGPIPLEYLRESVEVAATALVADGRLTDGEHFHFFVQHAPEAKSPPVQAPRFRSRELSRPLPIDERGVLQGAEEPTVLDTPSQTAPFPVVIHDSVLSETLALTRAAGDKETGGGLVGVLRRDPRDGVFLDVVAQLPARHTQAKLASLTFTPETWTALAKDLERRGRDELLAGWWHSHPRGVLGDEAKTEERSSAFFSPEDRLVHRAVFPRAFCVALVVGAGRDEVLHHALYGWRDGMVAARSFSVRAKEVAPCPIRS